MRFRLLLVSFVLLVGCSDFECPDGQPRVDGMCLPSEPGSEDPAPKTKTLPLACDGTGSPQEGVGWGWVTWKLTVNPGPIVSGEPFGAEFEATAVFPEFFVKQAQEVPGGGGLSRVQALDLRATIHVRRGVEDPEPVLLTFDRETIPWTCRYDSSGNEVGEEPDFPACSKENDNPDGSNEDCTGLGDGSDPDNPCAQFVPIPTSFDCEPGGVCDTLVYPAFGIGDSAQDLCERNGFCVTGPVEIPLTGEIDGYRAAASGHVLFGWDDVGTGAEIDQTGGPNAGTWNLPEADFDNLEAPNGMRLVARGEPVAFECTMAAAGRGLFGVNSRDDRPSPAPDHMLISFPIQEP